MWLRWHSGQSARLSCTSEVAGSILSENVLNVTRNPCCSHGERVSQRSAESRGYCPGASVFSHREVDIRLG